MAQKTDLNVNPYFDDFDADKNFYKVLFKPGTPVQSRELNNIQSILQNQIEAFGSHIFKEGSLVIPGAISYDPQYYAVKLNQNFSNIDIQAYIRQYLGKTIEGQDSGVTASVQRIEIPDAINNLDSITLYVKYLAADNNNEISPFTDGEILTCDESIIYGNNTVINAGAGFASLISLDAASTGSAVSVSDGIYFVRGTFAKIFKETIILDYYTNTPTYRVGIKVSEEIISAKDDPSLYDNAKGFNNYSAPGSDRFKLNLSLTKKSIDSVDTDTDFIEILRIVDGEIKKVSVQSQYNLIRDYLAQRTYDESGNYAVTPFGISAHETLNDNRGNDGLFFAGESTDQGNTPTDDLMSIKLSPGKVYVRGYDVERTVTSIIDVRKPRQTKENPEQTVNLQLGNLLRLNNVLGTPKQNAPVELHSERRASGTTIPSPSTYIGQARVYNFSLTDAPYTDAATSWDCYLYDLQMFTTIQTSSDFAAGTVHEGSRVRGESSGALGFAAAAPVGSTLTVTQVSGTFVKGERVIIDENENIKRSTSSVTAWGVDDVKQLYMTSTVSGFNSNFLADTVLERRLPLGFNASDSLFIDGAGNATCPGKFFNGKIKVGDILRYTVGTETDEIFNVVASVSPTGNSIGLNSVVAVPGVCQGAVQASITASSFSIGKAEIKNSDIDGLYVTLNQDNVATLDLNNSDLIFTKQRVLQKATGGAGQVTLNVTEFDVPIGSNFLAFDQERYFIQYDDGTIQSLSSEKFTYGSGTVTIRGLDPNKTTNMIVATFEKPTISSKIKVNRKSEIVEVTLSKNQESGSTEGSTVNDGLTYNAYYGLRVQDREISLNYPDVNSVLAVYESLNSDAPILDKLTFSSIFAIGDNAIVGENILGPESKTLARVVRRSVNSVDIVYLNDNRFLKNELVTFQESNIEAEIDVNTPGKYLNISNKFRLDSAQREQFYDYSRIVRKTGENAPAKRLMVIFDHFVVDDEDEGDLFTVMSYDERDYKTRVPLIGPEKLRASDTLDFRPSVPVFTGTTSSPFFFGSRDFTNSVPVNVAPEETIQVSYTYYIGRQDKLYISKDGEFVYLEGNDSPDPSAPIKDGDLMELATFTLPPYLYDMEEVRISLRENRRYTMRDIGGIESRVTNLENVTSLSLLELSTQTLEVQDSEGFNRFKSGFFVDDFRSLDRSNLGYTLAEIDDTDTDAGLVPTISRNSIPNYLAPAESIIDEQLDLSVDYDLFDPGVVKRNETVMLNYTTKKWIEQPLATRVENVNPFHVVVYRGTIELSPSRDTWTRTVELPDIVNNERQRFTVTQNRTRRGPDITRRVPNGRRRGDTEVTGRRVTRSSAITNRQRNTITLRSRVLVDTRSERFMRSRNTGFAVSNLKPYTRYYQFLDGNSQVDFIPKLLEISPNSSLTNFGSTSSFNPGETVKGYFNGRNILEFRVAASNHKTGRYDSPSTTFGVNPYEKGGTISSNYSNTSKVLNVDINSLCREAQGKYRGYVEKGMKLVGQTSGAVAYLKDKRLITDNFGDLFGSFFLKNPLRDPAPSVRINTGTKTYLLTSSKTNAEAAPGSTTISTAETNYTAEGTIQRFQTTITNITTTLRTRTNTRTVQRRVTEFYDPLAQSFSVGGSGTANDDEQGAFLSGCDVYFYTKDSGTNPVTVQVRTVELGTPTREVLGIPVVLRPDQVNTSETGTVPTHVDFPYPIYLAPGQEYAIVLVAPETTGYEVFIAEMGEKTLQTGNLPDSESVLYTQQFALGSLFKSQNGSIWTANQYQDMKFTLYRCEFTPNTPATAWFYNPTLDASNGYIPNLVENPITVIPRRLKVGITTTNNPATISALSVGRRVTDSGKPYVYGNIIQTGGPVTAVNVAPDGSGTGYPSATGVPTYNIVGEGSGLTLDITVNSEGEITSATINNAGNGYEDDNIVGIVTAGLNPTTGVGGQIRVSGVTELDTLFLTDVQGDSFNTDGTSELIYVDNGANVLLSGVEIMTSSTVAPIFDGSHMFVNHFNHGMYSNNNRVEVSGVLPTSVPTTIDGSISNNASVISVASTEGFNTFEGVAVGNANPGYALIENELIKYESIGTGTLETVSRSQDQTIALPYDSGTSIVKYETQGVSLRRINTVHDISDTRLSIDSYFLEIDRSANGVDRSSDSAVLSYPALSFSGLLNCGGPDVRASENIQFDTIIPFYNIENPTGATGVTGKIRTVSGTSVSGTEISFQDNGYEDIQLNSINRLGSSRIICSRVNEQFFLTDLPRNKSFTTALSLTTTDKYLSPQIFLDLSFTELQTYRINRPVTNYIADSLTNTVDDDPHTSIYVTNTVNLAQPATSLKVILSANRPPAADFRVLYSVSASATDVLDSYVLFPGFENLTADTDGDGYLDVIDPSQNNGKPDKDIPASRDGEYLEYEFSVGGLPEFSTYRIKVVMSSTNQATPPQFRDLRTLAVR